MTEILYQYNHLRSDTGPPVLFEKLCPESIFGITAFHQSIPGYTPTPLVSLKNLARILGLKKLWVKDESRRFDLKAFKILGASYAMARVLAKKLGLPDRNLDFNRITELSARLKDTVFVTATDGNHGRAVAWAAGQFNCQCVVYMPKDTSRVRLEAVRQLDAQASIIEGNFDDAVRLAMQQANERGWELIQDTSVPGEEGVAADIMQGYFTILAETLDQLPDGEYPTHIIAQAGVGSFSGAMQTFTAKYWPYPKPLFIIAEPSNAACIFKSMAINDGSPHTVSGDLDTIMAGLACGEPCDLGWQVLKKYARAALSCPDEIAEKGMRILGHPVSGDPCIVSGESGAVTAGVVHELYGNKDLNQLKQVLKMDADSRILLISTEGDTDPDVYHRIMS